jgi:hypothetical protein
MSDDRKLYIIELSMVALSSIVGAGLGFYGVYLGQKALTMSAQSESLQVRPLLTVERNVTTPSLKLYNIGFGPAEIIHLRLGYQTESGDWAIYDSDMGRLDGHFFNFFGLQGINEGLAVEQTIRSFDPVGVWGVDEVVNLLTVPGRNAMPQDWRMKWEDTVDRIVDTVEFCLSYKAIDGYEQITTSPDYRLITLEDDEFCEQDLPRGIVPYDAGQ